MQSAYDVIESKLGEARTFVAMWLRYQALWDMEPNVVFNRLGDDLVLWQRLLNEVKKSRAAVDTGDVCHSSFCRVIDVDRLSTELAGL